VISSAFVNGSWRTPAVTIAGASGKSAANASTPAATTHTTKPSWVRLRMEVPPFAEIRPERRLPDLVCGKRPEPVVSRDLYECALRRELGRIRYLVIVDASAADEPVPTSPPGR